MRICLSITFSKLNNDFESFKINGTLDQLELQSAGSSPYLTITHYLTREGLIKTWDSVLSTSITSKYKSYWSVTIFDIQSQHI